MLQDGKQATIGYEVYLLEDRGEVYSIKAVGDT